MMEKHEPSRPITIEQVVGILASTLALFFIVAFLTKSLDAYRLRSWRDRLKAEITSMGQQREELQEELRRRNSTAWVEEVLRDAGQVPDRVVSVMVATSIPVAESKPNPQAASVATPVPALSVSPSLFDNPYWRAWQELIWGSGRGK
jgi:hypothetical protein